MVTYVENCMDILSDFWKQPTISFNEKLHNYLTSSGDHVKGWGRKRPRGEEDSDQEEAISDKFRRGAELPSDLELTDNNSDGSEEPPDEISDGDWNMMGAALEREFLEGE